MSSTSALKTSCAGSTAACLNVSLVCTLGAWRNKEKQTLGVRTSGSDTNPLSPASALKTWNVGPLSSGTASCAPSSAAASCASPSCPPFGVWRNKEKQTLCGRTSCSKKQCHLHLHSKPSSVCRRHVRRRHLRQHLVARRQASLWPQVSRGQ